MEVLQLELELEKYFSKAYKRLYCYLREKLFQFFTSKQTVLMKKLRFFISNHSFKEKPGFLKLNNNFDYMTMLKIF